MSDDFLRLAAVEALVSIGAPGTQALMANLKNCSWEEKRKLVESIEAANFQPESVEHQLIYLFASQRWDDLVKFGKPATGILLNGLQEGNFVIKKSIIIALGELKSPEAIPSLLQAMSDDFLRLAAVEALVSIGAPGTQALMTNLKNLEEDVIINILMNYIQLNENKSEEILNNIINNDKISINIKTYAMEINDLGLLLKIDKELIDEVIIDKLANYFNKYKEIKIIEKFIEINQKPRSDFRLRNLTYNHLIKFTGKLNDMANENIQDSAVNIYLKKIDVLRVNTLKEIESHKFLYNGLMKNQLESLVKAQKVKEQSSKTVSCCDTIAISEYSGEIFIDTEENINTLYKECVNYANKTTRGFPMYIEHGIMGVSNHCCVIIYNKSYEDWTATWGIPTLQFAGRLPGTGCFSHYSGPKRIQEYCGRVTEIINSEYFS